LKKRDKKTEIFAFKLPDDDNKTNETQLLFPQSKNNNTRKKVEASIHNGFARVKSGSKKHLLYFASFSVILNVFFIVLHIFRPAPSAALILEPSDENPAERTQPDLFSTVRDTAFPSSSPTLLLSSLEDESSDTIQELELVSNFEKNDVGIFKNVKDIVQIGVSRSGSTFHYQVLCLMTALKFQGQKVKCYTPRGHYHANYQDIVRVTKIHKPTRLRNFIKENGQEGIFVFGSVTKEEEIEEYYNDIDMTHIVFKDHLRQYGTAVAWEYQKIFDLPDEQMKKIQEYLEVWDAIRLCCGSQMSEGWRQYLQGKSSDHHTCFMYDIGNVEKKILGLEYTKVIQKAGGTSRPSMFDGKLDGNYCEMYNDGVRRCKWEFNSWKNKFFDCPKEE